MCIPTHVGYKVKVSKVCFSPSDGGQSGVQQGSVLLSAHLAGALLCRKRFFTALRPLRVEHVGRDVTSADVPRFEDGL